MQIVRFKSFTLIELLIVIVIIGILATALIPRLIGVQARARDVARIADMKQMQNALELYYADNGNYPGSAHYANVIGSGCGHQANVTTWTSVFNANFQQKYLSSLPVDPRGNNADYCYGYTRMDTTSHYCTTKDGTRIDADGKDALGGITGPQGGYVLTFTAESDLSDQYPTWRVFAGTPLTRYCVLPPSM